MKKLTGLRIAIYPTQWVFWPLYSGGHGHYYVYLGPLVIIWESAER